jgi:hypothetical protein
LHRSGGCWFRPDRRKDKEHHQQENDEKYNEPFDERLNFFSHKSPSFNPQPCSCYFITCIQPKKSSQNEETDQRMGKIPNLASEERKAHSLFCEKDLV